jgi:hypothetical protein
MTVTPLADIARQLARLAERADKLAHKMRRLESGDVGYFHRVATHLSDFASIARSTAPPMRN